MINTAKLKGRMAECQVTQKDCAIYLKIAQPTFNQKINNIRQMSLKEAFQLAQFLEIDDENFKRYFLAEIKE